MPEGQVWGAEKNILSGSNLIHIFFKRFLEKATFQMRSEGYRGITGRHWGTEVKEGEK